MDGAVWFFDAIVIPSERLMILGVAAPLIALLFLFVWRSKEGQAMRAVAQDREAAMLQGINVDWISALGMFIGSALAAAAGLLLPIQVLTPAVGGPVVIKAFMVVILGGLGSIPGAVVGSLAFGALESFGTTFFGGYSSLAAFSAVMLILIFRPRGLLGRA